MLTKSKYIYEKDLDDSLFLLNLLTFNYKILDTTDHLLWSKDKLTELSCYKNLISDYFLVEDDSKLFNYTMKMLSNTGNRNPSHVIYVTDECNQRCSYCFEKSIDILGKKNKVLTNNQIDKIIHTISSINCENKKRGSITIFGGEPLLEKNKETVEYLLQSCGKNNISKVDIVTNGITLNSYINILNKYNHQIKSLIITLNGYKDMHELVRGSVNNPTFDIITKNIKNVLENTKNIDIRINILIDKLNIEKLDELLIYLKEEKISTDTRVSIAFGRIQFRTFSENSRYIRELPYKNYYSSIIDNYYENELIDDKMIEGSEVSILSKLYKHWKKNELAYPELKGCTAVYPGRFCYFVDDNIYPCTEISGIPKYSIGNYMKDGIDINKYNPWNSYKIKNLQKCTSCKFIGLCNGGCPVTNLTINNNINDVYCLNIEESLNNFIQSLYKKGFFYE